MFDIPIDELLEYHRTQFEAPNEELRQFIIENEDVLFPGAKSQIQLGDLVVDSESLENSLPMETEEARKYLHLQSEHKKRFQQEVKSRNLLLKNPPGEEKNYTNMNY